jgi:hypothetical protein
MNINRHLTFHTPYETGAANTAAWFKGFCNLTLLILGIGICLYTAVHGKYIAGGFAIITLLVLHVTSTQDQFAEASVIILVGIVGGIAELINTSVGIYEYNTSPFQFALLPTWIVSIWFVVGATVRYTFRWLAHRLITAAAMGAMLGSLTYYVASKLGVISFTNTYANYAIASSLAWSVAFPVIIVIGHRMFPMNSAGK